MSISFGNIGACIINMSGLLSAVIMVWALEKNLSIKNWYLNVTKNYLNKYLHYGNETETAYSEENTLPRGYSWENLSWKTSEIYGDMRSKRNLELFKTVL